MGLFLVTITLGGLFQKDDISQLDRLFAYCALIEISNKLKSLGCQVLFDVSSGSESSVEIDASEPRIGLSE